MKKGQPHQPQISQQTSNMILNDQSRHDKEGGGVEVANNGEEYLHDSQEMVI